MAKVPARFRELFPELRPDLGLFEPGPRNAITDVRGVRVGHATIHDHEGGYHSGVTAIWPREDVYEFRPRASGYVLHGVGEMTGLHQAMEWGLIETPILLTGTLNVGKVYDGAIEYLGRRYPAMGVSQDVLIPVVAECDDSHLSRARERRVGFEQVREALDLALASGDGAAVKEGSVGAGAGMIAFDFKGGIGTASRRVLAGGREFMLGVLVNANVGVRRQLRAGGRWVGRDLEKKLGRAKPHPEKSVVVVLATDAPMRPDQLRRLCARGALGLGRAGSFASHGSGEILLAFSTTLGEPRALAEDSGKALRTVENLVDGFLSPFYEAVVECVEESLLNAMAAGEALVGRDGNRAEAFRLLD